MMADGSALHEQPSSVIVKWRLESGEGGRKVERDEGDRNTESGFGTGAVRVRRLKGIGMGEFYVN
jgi:hypothetical protein